MSDSPLLCVVTGANSGIGRATALALARSGATVVLACRSHERAAEARASIAAQARGEVSTCALDLASLGSVREAAASLAAELPHVDVLVNSAGHTFLEREQTTDGHEAAFAVNVLGPFLFTELLEPLLARSAAARIVDLAGIYALKGQVDPDDLFFDTRGWDLWSVANATQLARVLLVEERARRLPAHVSVNAVHPGPVLTNAQKELPFWIRLMIHTVMRPGFRGPRGGAAPVVHLATSPEMQGITGQFFNRYRQVVRKPDPALAGALWERCSALAGP